MTVVRPLLGQIKRSRAVAAAVTTEEAEKCRQLADAADVSLSEWLGGLARQEIARVESLSVVETPAEVSIPMLDNVIRLLRKTKFTDCDEESWERLMDTIWSGDTMSKICALARSAIIARRQLDGE